MRAMACTALAACLATACAAPPPPLGPRPAGTGSLAVAIVGFDSGEGQALVNVFLARDGFPGDPDKAWRAIAAPIRERQARFEIDAVPAGPIAISVFHDADADFRLDTNLLGIPTERWGVSRDASGFLGPPSFDDARLDLAAGQHLAVTIAIGTVPQREASR